VKAAAITSLVAAFSLIFEIAAVRAQESSHPYPRMAPVEEYLMTDRDAEIDLARTAAPEAISRNATVLVLGRHGFETAVKGSNGFACLVERSWNAPFDDDEFWNPKIRAPICFNPPAARTLLLAITRKRAEMVMAGMSKPEIVNHSNATLANHEMPDFDPGSMCYMMSKRAYLGDEGSHDLAHLMLYAPAMDPAYWGAAAPNSPVIYGAHDAPEPFTEFIVAVGKWSDGSPAPLEQ
jgi:hypothetical protein